MKKGPTYKNTFLKMGIKLALLYSDHVLRCERLGGDLKRHLVHSIACCKGIPKASQTQERLLLLFLKYTLRETSPRNNSLVIPPLTVPTHTDFFLSMIFLTFSTGLSDFQGQYPTPEKKSACIFSFISYKGDLSIILVANAKLTISY